MLEQIFLKEKKDSASSSNRDKRHLGTAKNIQSKEQERCENQAEIRPQLFCLICVIAHFTGTSGAGMVEGTGECTVQPWSSGKHHW